MCTTLQTNTTCEKTKLFKALNDLNDFILLNEHEQISDYLNTDYKTKTAYKVINQFLKDMNYIGYNPYDLDSAYLLPEFFNVDGNVESLQHDIQESKIFLNFFNRRLDNNYLGSAYDIYTNKDLRNEMSLDCQILTEYYILNKLLSLHCINFSV